MSVPPPGANATTMVMVLPANEVGATVWVGFAVGSGDELGEGFVSGTGLGAGLVVGKGAGVEEVGVGAAA